MVNVDGSRSPRLDKIWEDTYYQASNTWRKIYSWKCILLITTSPHVPLGGVYTLTCTGISVRWYIEGIVEISISSLRGGFRSTTDKQTIKSLVVIHIYLAFLQEHYLPHVMRSKLKLACSGQDDPSFSQFLDSALQHPERKALLESRYSIDLALYCILRDDLDRARYYTGNCLHSFLQVCVLASSLHRKCLWASIWRPDFLFETVYETYFGLKLVVYV